MPEFTVLEQPDEIATAWATFCERMKRGGDPFKRDIGWPGGHESHKLYWHANAGIWCAVDDHKGESYYAARFGTENPCQVKHPKHDVSINPAKDRFDGHCGGLYVRNQAGAVSVAHTGTLYSRRQGVSKAGFAEFYSNGERIRVSRAKGQPVTVFLLGRLDDTDLVSKVAEFVHVVRRYKLAAVASSAG